VKMNSGKLESEILHFLFFLTQLLNSRIHAVVSKLLNLSKVLFRGILFYIVCAGGSDIDRRRYSGIIYFGNLV
jgi:hypothetical protein